MKFLSLFSGVEAASVAWKPLGFECVGLAEVAPFPSAVLAHRYPNVKNYGDVTQITKETIHAKEIDIIIGGSPCQAFSNAGLKGGMEDPRGRLMYDFIRIIGEVRPHYLVWENVRGVLSSDGGKNFGTLLGCLAEMGYNLEWGLLDTRGFGIAQSRHRIYVVGHLGEASGSTVLPFRERDCRSEKEITQQKSCTSAYSARSSLVTETKVVSVGRDVVGCLTARDYKGLGTDCVSIGKVVIEKMNDGTTFLRRLTPREYERLQGFPDDWTRIPWRGKPEDQCPDGHRYKAMGNSMSIPVVRWIGECIQRHRG